MLPVFGGPMGRHAPARGLWFDAAPWALLTAMIMWLLTAIRQIPCVQTVDGKPVNALIRLCYSDIPIVFSTRGLSQGQAPYTEFQFEQPVLTGAFVQVATWCAKLFGARIGPGLSGQPLVDATVVFYAVNMVLLGACFIGLVATHVLLGRESDNGRYRSFDAMLIAASPIVLASGLISWDLFPVALTSLALLAWARRRTLLSGVLAGLAVAAGFYPVVVVLAIIVLCLRDRLWDPLAMFGFGSLLGWLVANGPTMLTAPAGWQYFFDTNAARGADLGSLWYVMKLAGLELQHVSTLFFFLVALGWGAVIWVTFSARTRPRVGQVAFLLLAVVMVTSPVYSPQMALWMLPLVVLARPARLDMWLFTLAELGYFLACWGHLAGHLAGSTGPERLYWLAVFVRVGVTVTIAVRVSRDIADPWHDPVRSPDTDDPIGGVLVAPLRRSWPVGSPEAEVAHPNRRGQERTQQAGLAPTERGLEAVQVTEVHPQGRASVD